MNYELKYIKTPKGEIFKGNLDIELAYDLMKLENYYILMQKQFIILTPDYLLLTTKIRKT